MSATIPQVASTMQTILATVAGMFAHETHFVQRESKMTGPLFAQTLVFGWLANPQSTLEELNQTAATLGVAISPQGLAEHFTPKAAAFLQQVLGAAVEQLLSADPVALPLIQRFAGVYLQDSSIVPLPDELAEEWAGCGGSSPGPPPPSKCRCSGTGAGAGMPVQVGRPNVVPTRLWGPSSPGNRLVELILTHTGRHQRRIGRWRGVEWR